MKKSKAISLLLCLSLLASLLIPGTLAMPAKAAEGGTGNGMVISKAATANTDGTYTIQLEAYATGSKIISDVKKDVPTDIVLVLDQSSSMDKPIGTVSFTAYDQYQSTNYRHYNRRHNGGSGNLYYRLSDFSYAEVSVTKQEALDYEPLLTNLVNYKYKTYWGSLTDDCYYYYANNLYEKVGDGYKPVTLIETSSGPLWDKTYTYTYSFSDGTSVTSTGRDSKPSLGSHGPLYYSTVDTIYTYSYTDVDGIVQTIGTSTGDNTQFTKTLYQRIVSTNGGGSRLNALKSAVTTFANSVDAKAKGQDTQYGTDDDVNHRIAVVSFADSARNLTNGFIDMDKSNGLTSVTMAVDRLRADGNTYPAAGIKEANNIFSKNSIESGKRNRVIVLFTDGYPAPAGTDDIDYVLCDNAISSAYTSKHNYGATVYTVAIFSGANPNSDIDSNYTRNSTNAAKQLVAANRYMHYTSSNYPDARSMENGGSKAKDGYYLSAADADTLNNIFQKISDQIESGGSSTTLDESAVVKDIIAPAFALPTGTDASDIKLETYRYTGENTWTKNSDAMGARATVSGDQVSVTGFDFAENYVGTVTENGNVSYRGNKLVISFTVTPKAGFLGGNNVYTNTSAAVYENANAAEPVVTFPRPQVNVPIEDVTVTAADKNVYLLGNLNAEQIKSGATVKCGEVSLDLSKATDTDKPYGLDPWQTEYVDITVTVKDKDGNSISDKLENLTEDTTYTVEVTVSPKTKGTSTPEKGDAATAKTGINDPAANIYVFKPELTFKDSTAYYGESVPTNNDYSSNKVGSETWKHGDTASTDEGVTMLGTKPTLDISYTPDESKLEAGKYTKQDVPVAATVKIGTENVNEHTTFVHQDCTPACGWEPPATPGAPAFLIHIQTCTLTITKTDGAADESYVFDVYKDGSKYSEVTIEGNTNQTIYELPVGTYTIEEDTGWSWRYTPSYDKPNGVTLSASSNGGTITCTNSSNDKIYWLNGFSQVVRNIFGSNN